MDLKEPPNQISNTVYLHHKTVSYDENDHFNAPLFLKSTKNILFHLTESYYHGET